MGGNDSPVNGATHVDLGQDLLFLSVLQHNNVAVFVAKIDLAVCKKWRAPYRGKGVVRPIGLTCLGIETVQESAEIRNIDQAIGYGSRRNRAPDLVVMPQAAGLGDIAPLCCINRVEVADTFAVFRILSVGNVNTVFENHWRRDQFVARPGPDRVFRIGIELP